MTSITTDMIKKLRELTGIGIFECKKALIRANGDIKLAIDNIRRFSKIKTIEKSTNTTAEGIILIKTSPDKKYGAIMELNCETDFTSKSEILKTFGNKVLNTIIEKKISNLEIIKEKFQEKISVLINKFGENINVSRIQLIQGNTVGFYLHGKRIGAVVSVDSINAKEDIIKKIAMHIVAKKPEYLSPKDIPMNILNKEYQIQFDIAIQLGKSNEISKKIAEGRVNKFKEDNSLISQYYVMDQNKRVHDFLYENSIKINDFTYFEVGEIIKDKLN